jgi:Transposase DDE domain
MGMDISVLGVDLGKNVCSVVGLDASGAVVLRRRAKRQTLIALAAKLPPCVVAMEACCGAHHLGRVFAGQPHRRDHRQPIAESGGKGEAASRSEKNAVGYDAGKKVKGHKIHALVDVEGLPLHVIVHPAGIQDRGGAVLVLDKIRQRFPWLELIWADGRLQRPSGQGCRGQIRRGSGSKSSSAPTTSKAPEMGRRANLLMVWPQPPSRQRLPEPRRNSSRVRNPRRNPIRHQTLGPQVAF